MIDQEEEGVEEVIKMMYMGVLVDGLLAEATVAVVHINMNSHGKPKTNGQDHQVQATAAIVARPEVLLFGIGREVILLLVFTLHVFRERIVEYEFCFY